MTVFDKSVILDLSTVHACTYKRCINISAVYHIRLDLQ